MRIISKGQVTAGERRSAFTLIELLIVITIILILIGLLAAAVLKVLAKGAEATVQSELNAFATSIGAFQQEFGPKYIPSRLLLCEDGNYAAYNNTPFQQLATDSQQYLQQMFGSRFAVTTTQIDWNQDGKIYPTKNGTTLNPPMILEGQHCLVFFLGGIPQPTQTGVFGSPGTCLGFINNPTNPWVGAAGTPRGPFYEFKSSRLFLDTRPITGSNPATNLNFFVYIDAFNKVSPNPGDPNGPTVAGWTSYVYPRQPYAFFSCYRSQNGYNRYVPAANGGLGRRTVRQPTG